ncbi:MAG: DUF1453 domain-containing protein [Nonomuraea sp.]|nr:DUF1453 domain-containing protein [Nonomuraea sp.]
MTDALIFGAVFLVLVLTTQLGNRRHTLLLTVSPFVTSTIIGVLVLATGEHHYRPADAVMALLGVAFGLLAGAGLNATMRVRRDPETTHLRTQAGLAYLAVWLLVLVARVCFIAALENSPGFAGWFGRLLVSTATTPDGVSAFFLLMALTMVITREVGVLVRGRRIPASAGRAG